MSVFCDRFNELLTVRAIKLDTLAMNINVTVQTIYAWKAGTQQIYLSNLMSLCDYLQCSIDFISGRTNTELGFTPRSAAPFSVAIKTMMKNRGISTYRLRKDTKYDGSYFARWNKGSEPYLATLIELADYFKCTIDELVGRER